MFRILNFQCCWKKVVNILWHCEYSCDWSEPSCFYNAKCYIAWLLIGGVLFYVLAKWHHQVQGGGSIVCTILKVIQNPSNLFENFWKYFYQEKTFKINIFKRAFEKEKKLIIILILVNEIWRYLGNEHTISFE